MDIILSGSVFHHTHQFYHLCWEKSKKRSEFKLLTVPRDFSKFFISCFPCLLWWKSSCTGMYLLTADSKNGVRKYPECATWRGRRRWERCRTGWASLTALGNCSLWLWALAEIPKGQLLPLLWPPSLSNGHKCSGRAIQYRITELTRLGKTFEIIGSKLLLNTS